MASKHEFKQVYFKKPTLMLCSNFYSLTMTFGSRQLVRCKLIVIRIRSKQREFKEELLNSLKQDMLEIHKSLSLPDIKVSPQDRLQLSLLEAYMNFILLLRYVEHDCSIVLFV